MRDPQTATGRALITAHTGCERTTENSLASIVAGVEAGADSVEIDVRATKDEEAVLIHDPHVELNSRGAVSVRQVTLEELRKLEATEERNGDESPERVPLLSEALALARDYDVMVNLDIKDDESIPAVLKLVDDLKLRERVVISGCPRERAESITSAHPKLRVLLNAGSPCVEVPSTAAYQRFVEETYRDAIRAGCCGINIDYRLCREALVWYAHVRFLPVSVWTVNTPDEMHHMLELGVFAITTYEPRLLSRLVGKA